MAVSIRYFLRSVGLNVLNMAYAHFTHNPLSKAQKVFIRARRIALQRCMVHLLPCSVSITLIALNWCGFFVGGSIAAAGKSQSDLNLALLQVAAKLQELLMIASIGTFIFHLIQLELLRNDGVSFGLLGGGLLFNQISYFWSAQFIASLSKTRNRRLTLLIVISGILAITAGPATAILLIPSQVQYPAGSTMYYINGSADNLWPSKLLLSHYLPLFNNSIGEAIDCAGNEGYKSAVCPSGGYLALANSFSAGTRQNEAGGSVSTDYAFTRTKGPQLSGISIVSHSGQVAPMQITPVRLDWNSSETLMVTAHGATINLQQRLNFAWSRVMQHTTGFSATGNARLTTFASQLTAVHSQIPAVRVVCQSHLPSRNVSKLEVPLIPANGKTLGPTQNVIDSRSVNFSISARPQTPGRPSFRWLDIAPLFRENVSLSISAGALVEITSSDGNLHNAAICSVDARWAQGLVWSEFPRAFQGFPTLDSGWPLHDFV